MSEGIHTEYTAHGTEAKLCLAGTIKQGLGQRTLPAWRGSGQRHICECVCVVQGCVGSSPLCFLSTQNNQTLGPCWTGLNWMAFTFQETLLYFNMGSGRLRVGLKSALPQSMLLIEQIS